LRSCVYLGGIGCFGIFAFESVYLDGNIIKH